MGVGLTAAGGFVIHVLKTGGGRGGYRVGVSPLGRCHYEWVSCIAVSGYGLTCAGSTHRLND